MQIEVAILQLRVDLTEEIETRVARVIKLLDSLGEGTIAILPELWTIGAFNYKPITKRVLESQKSIRAQLLNKAMEKKIYLHLGSMPFQENGNEAIFNQSKVFDPRGNLILEYCKTHLFGGVEGERKDYSPGTNSTTASLSGMTVACAICYDLRFPELFRDLISKGAETFIVSASWPVARISHWKTLLTSRAIENQSYVLGCNAVGTQGDVELGGNSMIVNPNGVVVAELGGEEGVLLSKLDTELVPDSRLSFPAVHEFMNS
jgi:predicted amidohydrolase